MKRYRHIKGHRFELKTVRFLPTHAQHEKAEGKAYEKAEHKNPSFSSLKFPKTESFVPGQKESKGYPSLRVPKTESFVSEQQEEMGNELAKTNKTTGLWYPHKSK